METTINQTIIKTIEQAVTDNATYNLDVQKQDGRLVSVTAQVRGEIRTVGADGIVNVSNTTKGSISYNNGRVSCAGFAISDDMATYIVEFTEIINHLQERTE